MDDAYIKLEVSVLSKYAKFYVLATFFLALFPLHTIFAQGLSSKMYLKVPEENLRIAPGGKKIGSVMQGTEMSVLLERDNWVKVQITGWIWKESLSSVIPSGSVGEYRALHILVKTRAEAENLIKQINAGKDFSELAKSKSISPSAAKGGDLGFFDKGDFAAEIENAILGLKVNQVSNIVETKNGFNLFKRIK